VDSLERLRELIELLRFATRRLPVVIPLHPRTRGSLQQHGLLAELEQLAGLHLTAPLGYLEFISLVSNARAVVTDSGGIQEETTYLRVPCVTMRDNTERPITVSIGSNVLAGSALEPVRCAVVDAVAGPRNRGAVPPLWDGHAGERIVAVLQEELGA
jgi:UDP-N-acetylglucosamine 2-epimerase (non-hydrolysing)